MASLRQLKAIESREKIASSVRAWREKFSDGAQQLPAMGGKVYWHEEIPVWGYFGRMSRHYWIPFGTEKGSFRSRMLVQLNPPLSGKNANVQGVIATDSGGRRYILHQGRIHPKKVRVTEDMFDDQWRGEDRVPVTFKDASVEYYHLVACIDSNSTELVRQLGWFVRECARIRKHYIESAPFTPKVPAVTDPQPSFKSEFHGTVRRGPIEAADAICIHGLIVEELEQQLRAMGLDARNDRISGYGPDLRTNSKKGGSRFLFEVKTESHSAEIQTAVGQLLLYERLLKSPHQKIMVLPGEPSPKIEAAIDELGIRTVTFKEVAGRISIDEKELASALKA